MVSMAGIKNLFSLIFLVVWNIYSPFSSTNGWPPSQLSFLYTYYLAIHCISSSVRFMFLFSIPMSAWYTERFFLLFHSNNTPFYSLVFLVLPSCFSFLHNSVNDTFEIYHLHLFTFKFVVAPYKTSPSRRFNLT